MRADRARLRSVDGAVQDRRAIGPGDEGSTRVTRGRQRRQVSAPGSRNRCASQADSASSILITRSQDEGLAYGTLAGHPESGEEAFMVEHPDDDSVSFRITAFSRPASPLAKIAGPLAAVVQRQITARYLLSLSKIAV